MRKLRVGVWVNEDYHPEVGGGFGYYSQIINTFYTYNFKDAEITFISKKFSENWDKKDKSYEIKTTDFKRPKLCIKYKIINKIAKALNLETKKKEYHHEKEGIKEQLKKELSQLIDLIYYPVPHYIIDNFPYIYNLWDVGHLSMYAFPEVAMNSVYESRKHHHEIFPQKALMLFCESEQGKREAKKYLNLNTDRIKVIPLFPSEIVSETIDALKPSVLNENSFYIHYSAQFWSHKNHYNLLMAFQIVINDFPNLKLVLTGSDKGNKGYILELIKELGLSDNVIDLGFVKIEELKWVYKHSQGLVMPTFLGPTNIPLLEASELGCPVACSNLEGHREQLEEYAYYFDPLNPNEIAQITIQMIEDNQNNKQRIYKSNFNINNALYQIDLAFTEIRNVRFCWGSNDKIF